MNFKKNLTHILELFKTVLLIKFKRNGANFMSKKIFKINGIDICTESFGNSNDPAILLIMGATCSMIYWDEEFCEHRKICYSL